jgi:hypothetical protein
MVDAADTPRNARHSTTSISRGQQTGDKTENVKPCVKLHAESGLSPLTDFWREGLGFIVVATSSRATVACICHSVARTRLFVTEATPTPSAPACHPRRRTTGARPASRPLRYPRTPEPNARSSGQAVPRRSRPGSPRASARGGEAYRPSAELVFLRCASLFLLSVKYRLCGGFLPTGCG